MNRNLILAAIAAVAVAVGAFVFLSGNDTGQTDISDSSSDQSLEAVDTSGVVEMTLGEDDAAVTLIEYASFTCPHCRTFHENTFKQLKADYIDTGKVKFVYREVYFDRFGLWAGMVARCAGPDRYFGVVDLIYENQSEWTRGEPAAIAENLKRIGRLAGVENEQLDACLADGEKAQALNAFFQQNAQADGIQATPSFVINGETHSNMSYTDMKALLDAGL
ncbi:MAG: DsbA family protein [Pseudomonadota bacterium]